MTENEDGKRVMVVFRYDNFNDYIRDYRCWEYRIPKEGSIVYLLKNYGTVKSVKKQDTLTSPDGLEWYVCRIIENNTECVKRILNGQLDDLLNDLSTCKTIAAFCHVKGELTLEVDTCNACIDQASSYPKNCIAYRIPWLLEYIPTEVEYSLENLRTLKCVLMERFYKLTDVVFERTVTTKEKIRL